MEGAVWAGPKRGAESELNSAKGWKENWICLGFPPALPHPEPALHCPTTSLELIPAYGMSKSEPSASDAQLAPLHRGFASLARRQKCRFSVRKNKPWSLLQATKGSQRSSKCSPMKREMEGTTSHVYPSPVPKRSIPSQQSVLPSASCFGLHKSKRQQWQSKLDTGPGWIHPLLELWDARIWVRPILTQFNLS